MAVIGYAVGCDAVDGLCKALGIPDGISVESVALRVDYRSVATVAIEFAPTAGQVAAVCEWLEANRGRVLIDPKVVSAAAEPRRGPMAGQADHIVATGTDLG